MAQLPVAMCLSRPGMHLVPTARVSCSSLVIWTIHGSKMQAAAHSATALGWWVSPSDGA